MFDKNELRIRAKNIRKELPMGKISLNLIDLIRKNEIYINAKHVMIFYPTKYEVDLRELINDDKNFYLPRVQDKNLLVCPYCSNLKKSSFGVLEPCSSPINPENLDLVIVPALMCDENGYRLGYGGGFYDGFISKYGKNFKTICPIPKELVVKNLPVEKFDKTVDYIIKSF